MCRNIRYDIFFLRFRYDIRNATSSVGFRLVWMVQAGSPCCYAHVLVTRPIRETSGSSLSCYRHTWIYIHTPRVLLCTTGSCIHKTGKTEQLRNSSGGYVCSCYAYMRQARPLFLSSTGLYLTSYTRFSY